jgi:hypothetical protein
MQRILTVIRGEPVAFWTTLAGLVLAIATQLGLPVSQDVKNEVLGVIGSVYAICGLILRQAVVPAGKAQPPATPES